jgi:hypothetical protein
VGACAKSAVPVAANAAPPAAALLFNNFLRDSFFFESMSDSFDFSLLVKARHHSLALGPHPQRELTPSGFAAGRRRGILHAVMIAVTVVR